MGDFDNSIPKSLWFIAALIVIPGGIALLIAVGMLVVNL